MKKKHVVCMPHVGLSAAAGVSGTKLSADGVGWGDAGRGVAGGREGVVVSVDQ